MRARSAAVTMWRVASTRRMCRVMTSHAAKNASLLRRHGVAVRARLRERLRPRPCHDVHAERLAVAGDRAADPPVAVDAQRLAAQRGADADLPGARLERRHLLRDLAHRRDDQAPGELGGRVRRRVHVQVRRHDHAEPRARLDVDVRIDAALTDQAKPRQPLEQGCADLGALADQHQRFGVAQALRQRVDVLYVIVPDRDVVPVELGEAAERAQRVVVVVEDGDFHGCRLREIGPSGWRAAAQTTRGASGMTQMRAAAPRPCAAVEKCRAPTAEWLSCQEFMDGPLSFCSCYVLMGRS